MGELVELDVTTVEESVTVNVTEEGAVQISVVAETGPAGPAGPNTITTSTTTNLTGFISGNGTNVTGATAGATAATPNTLVLRNANGGGVAFTESNEDAVALVITHSGSNENIRPIALTVQATGNDSVGAIIYSNNGYGASIGSEGGVGAYIYSNNADHHVEFGDLSSQSDRSFIARTGGAFGWTRGDYTGQIKAAETLTDDRTYTLPDRSGNVALTEDYTGGTATIDVLDATVQGTLTADHIHGNLAGSVYAHIRAGETLAKGDPVYVSGSHGSGAALIPVVSKADASNAAKMPAVGVMDAAVANNANGHMVITGTITELDTNAYAVNTVLYVATGGGWTSTPPAANSQAVAIVERSNTNNGAVIVKVNGLGSSGGNGAADANKLVRYDSAGSFAIPGPYETDADAAYAGVPLDHLYYQPSGAVAASVDIPSLDLAFATDKSLTARFGPTPTFTRGSTGTFVGSNGLIQSAAINTPRFDHDPVTGICRGLLIEESRGNLSRYSGDIVHSVGWNIVNLSSTVSGTGPDGNNSYILTEAATTTDHAAINSGGLNATPNETSVVSGTTYTISIFLKKVAGSINWVQLTFGLVGFGSSQYANFNIGNGTYGNFSGLTSGTLPRIQEFSNGWYRCSITATATATASNSAGLILAFINNTNGTTRLPSYLGSASNSVLASLCQFEAGSFPTSYIPTTTTALTRSADVCSITGANFTSFWNSSEISVFSETSVIGLSSTNSPLLSFQNGTTNVFGVYHRAGSGNRLSVADSVNQNTVASGFNLTNVSYKCAFGVSSASRELYMGGSLVPSVFTYPYPAVDNLKMSGSIISGIVNARIARLQVYDKRLTNAKLQSLTAP